MLYVWRTITLYHCRSRIRPAQIQAQVRGDVVCLDGQISVVLLSCSVNTVALESPGVLPSRSIETNNNNIAHNHHTNNNTSFYIFLHLQCRNFSPRFQL